MYVTYANTKYTVKAINGEWRFRETFGARAGWKFVRLATVENPGLAEALLIAIESLIKE